MNKNIKEDDSFLSKESLEDMNEIEGRLRDLVEKYARMAELEGGAEVVSPDKKKQFIEDAYKKMEHAIIHPSRSGSNKFKYTWEGDKHIRDLLQKLSTSIYIVAEQAAEKDSKTEPIRVTRNYLDDAYRVLVKNPPRIPNYRFWHTVVILTTSFGVGCISSSIFKPDLPTFERLLIAGIGILIMTVSLLVDAFKIDQPQ
jgi:hypothetical protein